MYLALITFAASIITLCVFLIIARIHATARNRQERRFAAAREQTARARNQRNRQQADATKAIELLISRKNQDG